ncbi:MAG TPA: glycolate oxidase subunit GlcE [Casimicrobiaceae bacterium]|nr:glycolate oxidase subunit GlcE [Casimicrobiaceae bacterium]
MTEPAIDALRDAVRAAASDGRHLCIRGSGSKDFYGGPLDGDVLDTRALTGIVAYAPTELVVTARAGTQLADVEDELARHGQMLAFEPPRHGPAATLGGVVACGFSGPRRAAAGAARDFVLGVRIVDGTGEALAFGGQVIKNVAGFDVSRLMTGALGTLGVLTEISLKCVPRPRIERTRTIDCDAADAIRLCNEWGGRPLPISATCHIAGRLWVRLSGAGPAVAAAAAEIGGVEADDAPPWQTLRDQTHPFFAPSAAGTAPLWRLSVRSTAPGDDFGGDMLVEWGGALRWLAPRAAVEGARLRGWAAAQGGHATLYRAQNKAEGVFQPLAPAILGLHERLKRVFDPHGILNRGRLHPAF